jgi:tetratricopeptide (TPR) repeat protein
LLARSLNAMAHIYSNQGEWEEILPVAEEARRIYTTLGDQAMVAECLTLSAMAHNSLGQPPESLAAARRSLALTREIDNQWGQAFASSALSMALLDVGDYEEALSIASQGNELVSRFDIQALRLLSLAALGAANMILFRLDEAQQALHEMIAINEAIRGHPIFEEAAADALCARCTLSGDWEGAAEFARRAIAARDYSRALRTNLPRWLETQALLRAGDVEQASEDVRRFEALANAYPSYRFNFLMSRATLERQGGRFRTALTDQEEAYALTQRRGSPLDRWSCLLEIGITRQLLGETAEAASAIARAREIVQGLADRIGEAALRQTYLRGAMDWIERRQAELL